MYTHTSLLATSRPSCTTIVCAYNEEKTLDGIVAALVESALLDEVVVVDDGSADATPDVLEECAVRKKVHPIWLGENQGKGCAMAEGILAAVRHYSASITTRKPKRGSRSVVELG